MSTFIIIGASWTVISIAGAAFVGIMAVGWLIAEHLTGGATRSESRLDQLRNSNSPLEASSSSTSATDRMAKLLESASPAMSGAMKPKNEKDVDKLRDKLRAANLRSDQAVPMFYTAKAIFGCIGLFVSGAGTLFYGFDVMTLAFAAFVGYVFYMVPDIYTGLKAKKRKESIFLGLPDALDLMVVCVEAGLGLDQAMRRVAEEMQKSHKTIASEFELCNTQLQMGSTREIVLTDLGARNGVDDLKTLSSVIIQVDKFGTSVGKALRTQSDAMRVRRRQIAEEKAAKTAVQLIFPLVLFIFPGIFIVLVGPAAIRVCNDFLTL